MQYYKINMSKEAQKDLDGIVNYIIYELMQPKNAMKCAEGIIKKITTLQIYPERNAVENDFRIRKRLEIQLRKTFYKNYKIYYTIDEKNKIVYVLRIIHMLRNT